MNADVFAQVETFAFPYYQPATADSGPRLLGNEIILSEAAQALGTEGDVVFADLGAYVTLRRDRADLSSHLFFDYDASCFRWTVRVDGQPLLRAPLARPNSTNTSSTIVTLEDRS
jgi:HK97 family phage major capsid protein